MVMLKTAAPPQTRSFLFSNPRLSKITAAIPQNQLDFSPGSRVKPRLPGRFLQPGMSRAALQDRAGAIFSFLGYNLKVMNLDELTHKMHALVESKGWYAADSVKQQTPRNLAISLVLEAAEVLELFQWQSDCEDKAALAGELADTALFLLQLANVSGIDLEQAILTKIDQNQKRLWPEHLGKELKP